MLFLLQQAHRLFTGKTGGKPVHTAPAELILMIGFFFHPSGSIIAEMHKKNYL